MPRRHTLLMFSCLVVTAAGCSVLPPSLHQINRGNAELLSMQSVQGDGQFRAVAEAQSQNAIVLQVVGSETPPRVLPLPADGQPVYVSDLLRQSGLTEEFPRMSATLFRNSSDAVSGIRMGIRFLGQTNQIAPEHDYALRPGDRLEVAKLAFDPLESLGNLLSPSGGRRAIMKL